MSPRIVQWPPRRFGFIEYAAIITLALVMVGLAAFAVWGFTSPAKGQAPLQPTTSASVPIAAAGAGTVQLVAPAAGRSVYVTALILVAGAAGTAQLISGTGATCATGQASITGTFSLTANAGFTIGDGSGAVLVAPSGAGLCLVTSVAVQGALAFTQL